MEGVIKFMEGYRQLYSKMVGEDANLFFDSMINNTETVKIVSYKSIPELKDLIDYHIKKGNKKIIKQCYQNSAETTLDVKDVDYVEGILSYNGLPISHGWNVWKGGYYFDLTLEINERFNEEDEYYKMMVADKERLKELILLLGVWGPFSASHYLNKDLIIPHGI